MVISGTWHLLADTQDEVHIPDHRMDLRFEQRPEQLRASVLSRTTGEEMPDVYSASFDGEMPRLQLIAPRNIPQSGMPWLEMRVAGARLIGRWHLYGAAIGPELKLIQARTI